MEEYRPQNGPTSRAKLAWKPHFVQALSTKFELHGKTSFTKNFIFGSRSQNWSAQNWREHCMSLERMLQLFSCLTETQKEMVRNGTGSVSSRVAVAPHHLVCTNMGVIDTKLAGV